MCASGREIAPGAPTVGVTVTVTSWFEADSGEKRPEAGSAWSGRNDGQALKKMQ